MLSRLEHPNIVKYFDSCLYRKKIEDKPEAHPTDPEEEGPEIVSEIHIYMEYMNQGSIRQLIDRFGPFRNEEVLSNYAR